MGGHRWEELHRWGIQQGGCLKEEGQRKCQWVPGDAQDLRREEHL